MKLIQIARRGRDKVLSTESWHSATKNPTTERTEKVSLWFLNPDYSGASRYRVEMDRAEANRLRDFLNTMLPEASDESKYGPDAEDAPVTYTEACGPGWPTDSENDEGDRITEILEAEIREAEIKPEITPEMRERLAWKENEYAYCVRLCRTAGNVYVPPGAVETYFEVQASSALREGEMAISVALAEAAKILKDSGSFDDAFVWLVEQRETIAAS